MEGHSPMPPPQNSTSGPIQARRFLQLDTVLDDESLVVAQAYGQETLGRPFDAHIEFTATNPNLDFDSLLGTGACLKIGTAGLVKSASPVAPRLIHGFFSSLTFIGFNREGRPRFLGTIVPKVWFLTRTADCRIFQNKTVPEIIEFVLRDCGVTDFTHNLKRSYDPVGFCVQYRETDFDFIHRLMEREGIYYHFEHKENLHEMVLCDDMICHKPEEGHETVEFIGGSTNLDRKGVISEWRYSKQIKPGAFAHNDFNFLTPSPDPNLRLVSRATSPLQQKPQAFEVYEAYGGFGDTGEGSRYARLRMEEILADRDSASAKTDLQGMCAGRTFKLTRHPASNHNREYLITTVRWNGQEGGYGSGNDQGESPFFSCEFTCIPKEGVFRPACHTARPKIEGPQTATVCGPANEEIYVDDHGRVKVQFHWDRYGRSDGNSSCWVRVSQPWAGKAFGGLAIPRIGHEVIVEFIEGDPDRPIITGRVYNGSNGPIVSNAGRDGRPGNSPPTKLSQAAMMTSLKSDSLGGSGGYNEITMNDTGGAETLFFKAQKDEIHRVGNDRDDQVGRDEKRKVLRNRTRQVVVNEQVTVGVNRTLTVGSNQVINIGGNQTETIAIAYVLTIGAGFQVTVGGAMNETVGGAKATEVGLAHAEVVGGDRTMASGKKIVLTANDEIELGTGAAKIVMKSSGRIEITGVHISINSGAGIVEIDAAGLVTIKGPMVKINT